MIDFTTLQGLTIPEGVVTQITDDSGRVIWAVSGGKAVLEVEKITSDTYAGETTYTAEEFILLDIYPKTNGTVNITYGGLTKTITDTSGAETPNAQQVFFGTLYGVSDSVETPASGTLTIEGDYYAFAAGQAKTDKFLAKFYNGIIEFVDFGAVDRIPDNAFSADLIASTYNKFSSVRIKQGIKSIGDQAFFRNVNLEKVFIPQSVSSIGVNLCGGVEGTVAKSNVIEVDSRNTNYKVEGDCLIEISTKKVISGFTFSTIPSYVETIGENAFYRSQLDSITIPDSVTSVGTYAFGECKNLTNVTIGNSVTSIGNYAFYTCTSLTGVSFANTSGWYVTETKGGDASTGTAVDVSNPVNNVTLLTDTYQHHYWYRS